MPRGKKKEESNGLEIIATNIEVENKDSVKTLSKASEMVNVACCLAHGLEFDDVPNGRGGVKTITLPSVNDALRGKSEGILVDAGHAVLVRIAKSDWDAIYRNHGREQAFVGNPPCIRLYDTVADFNNDVDGEIKEMHTGLEAEDPAKLGVIESPKDER